MSIIKDRFKRILEPSSKKGSFGVRHIVPLEKDIPKIESFRSAVETTTINISTAINQALLDSYTFPVTINGGTLDVPVIITFEEDLIIDSIIGTNGYFIIGSDYITIDGQNNTVTINDVPDYPGLIQNGTITSNGYCNVIVENIGILSNDITTLVKYGGWLCQRNYGNRQNGTVETR